MRLAITNNIKSTNRVRKPMLQQDSHLNNGQATHNETSAGQQNIAGVSQNFAWIEKFKNTSPTYHGMARLLKWTDSDKGLSVKLQLLDISQEAGHPFSGMKWSPRVGEGERLLISILDLKENQEEENTNIIWMGEASLGWWANDCLNGSNISIKIDDTLDNDMPQRNPLRGLRTGHKTGEVLFCVCWAINDDETPKLIEKKKNKVPFSHMSPTKQAAIKANDVAFQKWCKNKIGNLLTEDQIEFIKATESDVDFAASVIRIYCGVNSRAEFNDQGDHGEKAREKWLDMLKRFDNYVFMRKIGRFEDL